MERPCAAALSHGADAMSFGPHTARLCRAARATGLDARLSRDAGSYLCNYLCWRALEAGRATGIPRLAAFVHIPQVSRDATLSRTTSADRITLDHLVDAGEALLLQMMAMVRRK